MGYEPVLGFALGVVGFFGVVLAIVRTEAFIYHWTNGRRGGGCTGHRHEGL
mgnify:CR=1 FL=1